MREEMKIQDQKDTVSADEKHDRKLSGAMRIFQALSSVDEELLVRSEEEKKVIPFRRYTKVMAACACFVMLGVVMITSTRLTKDNSSSDCAAPEMAMRIEDAGDSADRDGAPATDMDANITAGGMDAVAEEEAAEAPAEAEALQADSVKPDLSLAVSGSGEVGTESAETVQLNDASGEVEQSENEKDGLVAESALIDDAVEKLAEKSLRATDVLGEYVPTEIPEGYVFADGYRYQSTEGPKSVNLTWLNGMDYITISVLEYVEETELTERLVVVNQPETYDVHLYEIPYASTVPEEYRTTFDNPIFAESEFTIDIVKARMKSVNEAGDTDTPRGNFAVLYDSGVLVEFSGRGDAETIWNMFQSIEVEESKKE